MKDETSDDPFSVVYEGLWKLVDDFKPFASTVRRGNRIKLDGASRNPTKQNVNTADLPEVTLQPTGGETNIHSNSSQTTITQRYMFMISTGDLRVDSLHFPLRWHVTRAVVLWKKKIGGITWRKQPFLEELNIPDTTEGESDPDRNRGIKGWSSLITIEVRMRFANVLLEQE